MYTNAGMGKINPLRSFSFDNIDVIAAFFNILNPNLNLFVSEAAAFGAQCQDLFSHTGICGLANSQANVLILSAGNCCVGIRGLWKYITFWTLGREG